MDKIVQPRFCALLVAALCLAPVSGGLQSRSGDLHSQAASAILQEQFTSSDISYLLIDKNGTAIAQRWEQAEREVPIGSLIKPFLAVAYGRSHSSFPIYRCTGGKTCWLPRGHGSIGIRDAVAQSCNSYFHQLYTRAKPGFANALLERHRLSANSDGHSGSASPTALVRAYLELAKQPRDRVVAPVIDGMALSAKVGTAKAAGAQLRGLPVLAKTGTAPCTHSHSVPGDGFAVLITPAENPEMVLLVRVHGKPGAFAAGVAGKMFAAIESAGAAQ